MKTTNYFKMFAAFLALAGITTLQAQSPCTPTLSYVTGASGSVTFNVASGSTVTPTMYIWRFMPAAGYISTSGTVTTQSYSFPTNGPFQVSVTYSLNGGSACWGTDTQTLVITNAGCNLNANFAATSSFTAGNTYFVNSTTNTNWATTYLWSYGDGTTGTGDLNHTHVYPASGTYIATLTVNNNTSPSCTSTKTLLVNVPYGPPCVANAGFTLTPTGTPQVWNATPAFAANITAATWNWGDGSTSNTLYTSHTYSAAGTYSICLSITADCGDTATSCFSYAIFRSANTGQDMNIIRVDVVNPLAVGIHNLSKENDSFLISPNPNNGCFKISIQGMNDGHAKITVYNATGKLVHEALTETSNGKLIKDIQLKDAAHGVYFIKVDAGNRSFNTKVILNN